MATITPLEEGKKAFHDGLPLSHNPYAKYSDLFYHWQDGWKAEWWGTADWRPR